MRRKKRKYRKHTEEKQEHWNLSAETKSGIFTIIIFVVAFLSFLSIFGLAGRFGEWLNVGLGYLFGAADLVFILILLILGYILIKTNIDSLRKTVYIGLSMVIISITGILNFFVNEFTFKEIVKDGIGGGAFGFVVGLLEGILGFWGTLIILIALFLIGIFLAFNTSFRDITEKAKSAGVLKEKFLPAIDEYDEDDEEEYEGEEEVEEEYEEEYEENNGHEEENNEDNEEEKETKQRKNLKTEIPLDLLIDSSTKPDSGDINANMNKIKKTFDSFGIEVTMVDVNVGPTVTQYTLKPAEGVRLSQMLTLQNDLALALAAHPLRMEAPIPGKSLVGIEVPNHSISTVKIKSILGSNTYKQDKGNLKLGLGKDVAGNSIIADLTKMPHLLIAGATNSGKSVAINNIIISLMYQCSPQDLNFILIDPKRVELVNFQDIPHLITPVINDADKAINALRWVIKTMNERYKLLQAANKKNINSYNKSVIVNKLPYMVVIIDEFSALMSMASKEIESAVVSLAQLGRAAGIHLILATQRPSVDVITGLIKANMPSRIAFAVASATDSKTILDSSGAEKLLGNGDMLFVTSDASKAKRIQGAYITDEEVMNIVNHVKEQAKPEYDDSIIEKEAGYTPGFSSGDDNGDSLTEEAKEIVLKAGKASATLLQRHLRIGYPRAASLLDALENMGIVGSADGSKAREVLVSQEDLEENFSSTLDEEDMGDVEENEE